IVRCYYEFQQFLPKYLRLLTRPTGDHRERSPELSIGLLFLHSQTRGYIHMSKRPNILFILSDQHRYDSIGYSKDYPVLTPNLDRLAAEGASFTNAYTPIPLC